jgi:hypothetical protein
MKYFFIVMIFGYLYGCDCGNKVSSTAATNSPEAMKDSVPVCVRKLIDESKKDLPPNPPEQVDEYLYEGKKVFLFTAGCCDHFNVVYDESCKMICAPSGGITGKGDGNCTSFIAQAKYVKLVWKNDTK